jgi:glutamate synthase (NADPH/NADH) small chain
MNSLRLLAALAALVVSASAAEVKLESAFNGKDLAGWKTSGPDAFWTAADGVLTGVKVADTEFVDGKRVPKPGTERILPADLVFLALGFVGPETQDLSTQLATPMDSRGNVARDGRYKVADGLFAAGDAGRGQSLIVWAIAEGRAAAAAIDEYLEGETGLPFPVKPTDRPISVYS